MSGNADAASRRAQILHAAERLVRHYGFQKTTVGDIAREAHVGVGTVYLEFQGKDAIVEELSRLRYTRVLEAMKDAAARNVSYERRLKDVLDARVQAFLRQSEDGHHAAELLHCVCPAVKQAHARFVEEEESLLAELLAQGSKAGELQLKDPPRTARVVLRAYASFSPPWIFSQPRDEVLGLHTALHNLILKGLLKRI